MKASNLRVGIAGMVSPRSELAKVAWLTGMPRRAPSVAATRVDIPAAARAARSFSPRLLADVAMSESFPFYKPCVFCQTVLHSAAFRSPLQLLRLNPHRVLPDDGNMRALSIR